MMQTKLWQADSVAVLMPLVKKGIRNRVPINICEGYIIHLPPLSPEHDRTPRLGQTVG